MNMKENSVQVAVIGCGRWGKNHVRTLSQICPKNFIAICDTDDQNLANAAKLSPSSALTKNPKDIFANPKIQAVVIATPAHTHFELAQESLSSGKHTFVEKPLALFSEEAKALTKLAEEKNLCLMVGHILLYHPAIEKIHEIISQGKLGKIQYLYSNRLNLGTVRKEENILWSFAPHDISVFQYLLGSKPKDVSCKGAAFLQPGIHDVTVTNLTYPGNIHGHIHVSWLHPFKEHRLVIIGDKSMLVFEDTTAGGSLVLHPKGIDWIDGNPHRRDTDMVTIPFEKAEPLARELNHFLECIQERKTPKTDGHHAIEVLEILERAHGALTGEPEKTPISDQSYFAHSTAVVDDNVSIGTKTKIWHYSHIQSGTHIGQNCSIGQNVNVGNNVRIGDHVKVQNNVSIYEGVELEDYVFCGPSMVFTNVLMPRSEFPQRGSEHYQKTLIKRGASLGANCTIVCGNTVNEYAFVGAGAVITKDVPAYALMIGNPAKIAGWVCRCGTKLEPKSSSTCSKCARRYSLSSDGKKLSHEFSTQETLSP